MRKTSKTKIGQTVALFDLERNEFIEHGVIMALTRRGAVFRTVEIMPARIVPIGSGVGAKIIKHTYHDTISNK